MSIDTFLWILACVCFAINVLLSVIGRPGIRLDLLSLGLFFGALTFVL